MIKVLFKKLREDAIIPKFATEGAAGFDFHACRNPISNDGKYTIFNQSQSVIIPLGLSVEIPKGYELQIRSRSGLAFKNRISLLNGIGTIDSDYRGELAVILYNYDKFNNFVINPGDRICQGVIAKLPEVELIESVELSDTERGSGGFGSTGI